MYFDVLESLVQLGLVACHDDNVGALGGEELGQTATHALRSARDDDSLRGNLSGAIVPDSFVRLGAYLAIDIELVLLWKHAHSVRYSVANATDYASNYQDHPDSQGKEKHLGRDGTGSLDVCIS